MALRVPIQHVSRRGSGTVPGSASMFVYLRGTTTQKNVYAAATGGAAASQPIAPDANGNYNYWVEEPGRYDLVETIDGIALPAVRWEAYGAVLDAWVEIGSGGGAPAFSNAWVNFAGGYATAAYTKSNEGLVKVKGLIKSGTVGLVAFTLPAGYRPALNLIFPAVGNGAIGRVDVNSNGQVIPQAPTNNGFVTLDQILFKAEQ